MREHGIEAVGGGHAPAEDVSWVPPANAVHPINHFHTLYMRLTEITEGLLRQTGSNPKLAENDAFAELLGACGSLSNTMGHLTRRLGDIRREFPEVWDAWCAAVKYQPSDEKETPHE